MRSKPIFALFIISLSQNFCKVHLLNLLGVFAFPCKSHFFLFKPYLEELAQRGNNVTVISYFPQQTLLKNYHDISLANKAKILEDDFRIERSSYYNIFEISLFVYSSGTENCRTMLGDENVQNLWKSKQKFDLVMVEQFNSDCSLGLAHILGAPVIGLTSHVFMPWHYKRFGAPYNPSYVPFMFLGGGTKPTLYQRVERTVFHAYFNLGYKIFCQRVDQSTLAQYFDNVPPLEELTRKMKFLLTNTHFVLTGSYLYPPNVIEIGGLHVTRTKPLPADLEKFINESQHGVIYVSFGSVLKAALTPKDKIETIISALAELPQRAIWKWEEDTLPGDPKNIYVSKWMPQNDILSHPKVLAFFSHCGLFGTTEAMYHGVPVVGMPILGDQPTNAAAMEEIGLGVQIQLNELSKEKLIEKFKSVLNPKFREQVKKISKAWHDRPVSPMDTAIFWTEFAARHNFTFRAPAADVPYYQYANLDIIVVLTLLFIVILVLVRFLLSVCFKSKKIKRE